MKLYRRKDSPVWYVSHGSGKKRIMRSTGATDYSEARRMAEELVAPAALRDEGARIAAASAAVSRKMQDAALLEANALRLSATEPPNRTRHGEELKPSTRTAYLYCWRSFRRFAEGRGVFTLGGVTPELAAEFLDSKPARMRQVAFFVGRRVFAEHGLPSPFGASCPRRRSPVTHREPLTPEEEARLLATADRLAGRLRNRFPEAAEYPALLRLMLLTGLRLGDAVTLKWEMVDTARMTLSRTMAKTSRTVRFPLHPSLVRWLERRDETYVFPALAGSYLHRPGCASQRIREFLRTAGIAGERQQYCAHCLRTTFASKCARAGVPLAVIQSWLGHTSQEVTRIYARIEDMAAKREALLRLPGL